MAQAGGKGEGAFRTIGDVAGELGVPQHILRYWETKFPLRPLQRAGNRRYYRPADVALARRIHRLLNEEGYTMRGAQALLAREPEAEALVSETPPSAAPPSRLSSDRLGELEAIRASLAAALIDDARVTL